MPERYIIIPGDSPYRPEPDEPPVLWAEMEEDWSGVLHDYDGNTRVLPRGWDEDAIIEEYLQKGYRLDPELPEVWLERIYDWRRFETKSHGEKPRPTECTVEGCGRTARALGLCSMHYQRQKRLGTTELPLRPNHCIGGDCGKPPLARGLCSAHYHRVRRLGTTELAPRATGCAVDGCERPHYAHGLCSAHYQRQRRGLENPARKPKKGRANATHAG